MTFDIEASMARVDEMSDRIQFTMNSLSPVERAVLQHRFGLFEGGRAPLSVRKAAQEVGIPKSTAYDAETRALAKLKRPLRIG